MNNGCKTILIYVAIVLALVWISLKIVHYLIKMNRNKGQNAEENYENIKGQISLRPVIDVAKHIKLNKFNRVDKVGIHPPKPNHAEKACKKVKCPSFVGSDAECWKCY